MHVMISWGYREYLCHCHFKRLKWGAIAFIYLFIDCNGIIAIFLIERRQEDG
ncbi:hypothetical protein HMPREF3037_01561 [Candidatus Stoquefichus sp. KLE1796]|nr:hypothetical protein HMPREF3037_01561 [Candidatus Stoquefichus sp. KLE1796]